MLFAFEDYSGLQSGLMGAVFVLFLGIGGLVFGYFSDVYGRIIAVRIAFLYKFLGGFCFIMSPTYTMEVVFVSATAFGVGALMIVCPVIVNEYVSEQHG
mmetsp:Transcript_15581/g.2595  ORF Transcript_15581/g.2595 Transcript_15581/m.2595 type:complete len:99 (-) Transcript_15581:856-1152(-)